MDGDVLITIICRGTEYKFPLEDVLPEILQENLELEKEPKILHEEGGQTIIGKRWQQKLRSGWNG